MQMETLFPLPLASAAVLERRGRNSGSPQSKGTAAERSLIKPGASPHMLLYQVCVGLIARQKRSRAGRWSPHYQGRLIVWRQ